MPEKYEKLRREMRANFELTWAGQADSNTRIEEIAKRLTAHSTKIEDQGGKIEEQGQQIAEQGRQIAAGLRDTAAIGREVAAIGHQMVGRFRLMDDRFGKFLDVLESEAVEQRDAITALEERVTRLEERQGPAA